MRIFTPLLLLGFALLPLSAAAQTDRLTVKGLLTDSLTATPEPYATCRLLEKGKVVKVVTTDADGHFSIDAKSGKNYVLEISSLGKAPLKLPIASKQNTLNLGTLHLSDAGTTLAAATITAQRPLVRAEVDKLTYTMADDPDARTSTLLEMLRKVPMVTVDGEDNIKVKGSTSFQVHVNGRPNKMMTDNPSLIFKNYPASAIKRIEVVSRPGAKYDAEGVAGILNIITETETKTSGYSFSPSIRVGTRNSGTSGFGTTQFGALTLSLNYGVGTHKNNDITTVAEREVFDDPLQHLLQENIKSSNDSHYAHGSIDASYEFSKNDLLSFSLGFWGHGGNTLGVTDAKMLRADGTTNYAYAQRVDNDNTMFNLNSSLDFQHTFAEGRNLTLSYRLSMSPETSKRTDIYSDLSDVPTSLGLTDRRFDSDKHSYEHTFQADYTATFAKLHTLSVGGKYIYRLNNSDNDEWQRSVGTNDDMIYDEETSLRYRHRGDVMAAYAEYKLNVGKFSLQTGLRDEYFRIKANYPDGRRPKFTRNINNLVPNVNLGYTIRPGKMLTAGYAMRISRPVISQLSPYVQHTKPMEVSYGNPTLESELSHQFEATYSMFSKKFSLNLSAFYRLSTNGITPYMFVSDGVVNNTYIGQLHEKSTGVSLYANWTVNSKTSINLNGNGGYKDTRCYATSDRNSGWGGDLWMGVTQTLPWRIKGSLWMGGNTAKVALQSSNSSFLFHSISLSRAFLKDDRLTVSLRASMPFKPHYTFENTRLTPMFRSTNATRVSMANYSLSLRYRFGTLKAQVKKAARTIKNDDVKSSDSSSQQEQGMQ